MTTQLIKYDAACRAIAEAKSVDEVKEIRDVSIAMKYYARQAKNHEMEADAVEIRMRATRRLDKLRQEQKATIGLNTGTAGKGRPSLGGIPNTPPKPVFSLDDDADHDPVTGILNAPLTNPLPTLAEAGIDKNLATEMRKLGAMSDEEFDEKIQETRDKINRVVKDIPDEEIDTSDIPEATEEDFASTELVLP